MISIDANIIVRIVTVDDLDQAVRARRLVEENDVWLSRTVVHETAWVLRSHYGFKPAQITFALRRFFGLSGVRAESREAVLRALGWVDQGMGFPDAIHLSTADSGDVFASFDQKLARLAKRVGVMAVRTP